MLSFCKNYSLTHRFSGYVCINQFFLFKKIQVPNQINLKLIYLIGPNFTTIFNDVI
jgi:hypothetical protein